MQHLIGEHVIANGGEVVPVNKLVETKIIGLYFSASWCPPCKKFSELLIPFYETVNEKHKEFEVVLFPFDQNEDAAKKYFAHMPWLSVPFGNEHIKKTSAELKVNGIPAFFIYKHDGTLISSEGRKDVTTNGEQALKIWKEKAGL